MYQSHLDVNIMHKEMIVKHNFDQFMLFKLAIWFVLEMTHEKQVCTHHLFVGYKAAFDRPIRDRVFCRNVWAWYTCEADKAMQNDVEQFPQLRQGVGLNLSEPFDTVRGFRQGDPL